MDKFKNIKAFAFDIDGVLTDGGLYAMHDGDIIRQFNSKDGFAIRMAVDNGFPVAIITGGCSESIIHRANSYGVKKPDLFMMSRDKLTDFNLFCERNSLRKEEVAYVGDDLPDVPVILAAGLGVCPCDAVPEAVDAADYVSPYPGGRGCVRDLIEKVLREAGKWLFDPHLPMTGKYPDNITKFAKLTGRNV
ncbi:MAG: HAD hydrolase family protein [Bacteroidales bacterium]|nr:HAD hydrolase family protein [Candidatus Cacconaster merdequi]